jgi:hypothetical protein
MAFVIRLKVDEVTESYEHFVRSWQWIVLFGRSISSIWPTQQSDSNPFRVTIYLLFTSEYLSAHLAVQV